MASVAVFLKSLLVAAAIVAPSGDAWFAEAGHEIFDSRRAVEIKSFWLVPLKNGSAVELLKKQAFVKIAQAQATNFVGHALVAHAGESFYLIRSVDVAAKPIPLRMYQIGGHVHVAAGTFATCIAFKPSLHPQPLVAALSTPPTHLSLSYSCDG